jgi:hypothetical protein
VSILVPPEITSVLDYNVYHPDEAEKETGEKKPGAGLKFFVKLIAKETEQDNNARKLGTKSRPFHNGLPFLFIRLVFLWGHLGGTLIDGFERIRLAGRKQFF